MQTERAMQDFKLLGSASVAESIQTADWSRQSFAGETALHAIAQVHDVGVLQSALGAGAFADAGAGSVVGTPLHTAAARQSEPHIRVLISAGASLKAEDATGATALHVASRHNNGDLVGLLCKRGAPIDHRDATGSTALHAAAAAGASAAAAALLDAGANAAVLDDRNRAPFQLASGGLADTLQSAAVGAGWKEPGGIFDDIVPDTVTHGSDLRDSGSKPVTSAGNHDADQRERSLDLSTSQIAQLAVSALHEKIQSSLETGAIEGYQDIYRALDEPGVGWFEGKHLASVCQEIDIPADSEVIPDMMRLIAEPAAVQSADQDGGIQRITWKEFEVFCTSSRPAVDLKAGS